MRVCLPYCELFEVKIVSFIYFDIQYLKSAHLFIHSLIHSFIQHMHDVYISPMGNRKPLKILQQKRRENNNK